MRDQAHVVEELTARLNAELGARYRVERPIGRGGMAIVFLAQDLRHHRPVAIKVLDPVLTSSITVERFLREIEFAARLTHPNILPLYDSGVREAGGVPDTLYYVMPYVAGESLRRRIERERQLPIPDAMTIAVDVADALAYAHQAGIVHRDIKPENILLAGHHALVADFGIARAISAAAEGGELTTTGVIIGTVPYMSPEQASGDRALDARSDIYSLGCVIYEMLAGAPPYSGPTPHAIAARRLSEPPPRLRTVRPLVSVATEQTILRALAIVPADRFASAEELRQSLLAADGVRPSTPAPAAPPEAHPAACAATPLPAGHRRCARCGASYSGERRFCEIDGAELEDAVPERGRLSGELAGSTIDGRYQLERKLGEGGMGQVWLATHLRMGRRSAVKLMLPEKVGDGDSSSRFRREAANAARLSHPNIATVYDFGTVENGVLYLAMEFVDGSSLAEVIEREGPLEPGRVADIAEQTAAALSCAHRIGLVHRDLKPANILLARDGDGREAAKVVDFGISKQVGDASQGLTEPGFAVGTPEYMSPEQLCGDPVDARSDVFSLAIVIFEALTGRLPFTGATEQEMVVSRLTKPPRPIAEARPEVAWSRALQEALDRAMQRDPALREADVSRFAGAVAGALRSAQRVSTTDPTQIDRSIARQSAPDGTHHSGTRPPRRLAAGRALLLAALILGMGVGGRALAGWRGDDVAAHPSPSPGRLGPGATGDSAADPPAAGGARERRDAANAPSRESARGAGPSPAVPDPRHAATGDTAPGDLAPPVASPAKTGPLSSEGVAGELRTVGVILADGHFRPAIDRLRRVLPLLPTRADSVLASFQMGAAFAGLEQLDAACGFWRAAMADSADTNGRRAAEFFRKFACVP